MSRLVVPLVLVAMSLLVAVCGSAPPEPSPTTSAGPTSTPSAGTPGSDLLDPDGNVVLYVSNQSFEIDPVDVVVAIDGEPVIAEEFAVANQHNWKKFVLRLSPGRHTLTARSGRGAATLETSFVVKGAHWAVLDYWYYSEAYGSPPEPRHFEFMIQDEPVAFD